MITSGLYYPYIHFRDDAWLKLAALYWDRIGRIVPTGYATSDSETVRELSEGIDFIWEIHPESFETALDSVASRFISLLDQNRDRIRTRYRVAQHRELPPEVVVQHNRRLRQRANHSNATLGYIWHTKVSWQLLSALDELDLTLPRVDGVGEWVGMHPKLMAVYMTALAQELARETGLSPVADGDLEHLAGLSPSIETLGRVLLDEPQMVDSGRHRREDAFSLALIAVQAVAPKDIGTVPASKIIKLRTQHATEFTAYQIQIRQLIDEILGLETRNPAIVQQHLDWLVKHRLQPRKSELEKMISSSGIDVGTAALDIALVAAPGALLSAIAADPVVSTGATLALGTLTWFRGRRGRIHDNRRQDPVASFLLRIDQELKPDSRISQLSQRASLFRPHTGRRALT